MIIDNKTNNFYIIKMRNIYWKIVTNINNYFKVNKMIKRVNKIMIKLIH
jgi:hypothetical protein